jgi:site-specific recombinase XerD
VRSIGKQAGLSAVYPHMLRSAFIMAALDAGVPLRDVQIAARHADPRTTTVYDRRRENFDRRAAHRWVRSIGKQAGLSAVYPHMLRSAFIMAALDAGVPLRDVQIAARHADPRTTTVYDRRPENFDRRAAYVVVTFVAGG